MATMPKNKMDLIERAALCRILEDMEAQACEGTENDGTDGTTRIEYPVPTTTREMLDLIASLPAVEAEPVVRAKWVVKFDGPYGKRRTYCSNCQKRSGIGGTKQEPPRCPHCGAWMEKGVGA